MTRRETVTFNYGNDIKIEMDRRGFIQSASGLEKVFGDESLNMEVVGCHLSELKLRVKKFETYHDVNNGFSKTLNEKHNVRKRKKRR